MNAIIDIAATPGIEWDPVSSDLRVAAAMVEVHNGKMASHQRRKIQNFNSSSKINFIR